MSFQVGLGSSGGPVFFQVCFGTPLQTLCLQMFFKIGTLKDF